jgi:hypothetical protein
MKFQLSPLGLSIKTFQPSFTKQFQNYVYTKELQSTATKSNSSKVQSSYLAEILQHQQLPRIYAKKYLKKICNNSSSQRFSAQVAQITSTEQISFHFIRHINCNPSFYLTFSYIITLFLTSDVFILIQSTYLAAIYPKWKKILAWTCCTSNLESRMKNRANFINDNCLLFSFLSLFYGPSEIITFQF